jgi:hypothetical protein
MTNDHYVWNVLTHLYEQRMSDWIKIEMSTVISPDKQRHIHAVFQLAKNGLAEIEFSDEWIGCMARITLTGIAVCEGTLDLAPIA